MNRPTNSTLYSVKEVFYTLQGEGGQAGRAAVFCRFAGCNLWSGREQDRATAICTFCDTDFVGTNGVQGGKYTADALSALIAQTWHTTREQSQHHARPLVVFTGGEPLLQLDDALTAAVHARGFEIAVESNGTITAPDGIDWLCISPKADAPLVQRSGNELKLVFPQPLAMPERFVDLAFDHFFLQPMDSLSDPSAQKRHTQLAAAYCLQNPQWRLSIQMHKIVGLD
jgi:7-carboxy-7-deazaguanine synthase (Cx14CxxC type)